MGRILVVDDEPGLRAMLEVVLRRDGHEVATADGGQQALELLGRRPGFELMLSDLRMDGVDGLELLVETAKFELFSAISAHLLARLETSDGQSDIGNQ